MTAGMLRGRIEKIPGIDGGEEIEIFDIPRDYPYMEDETGQMVQPGIYFWYVTVPHSVPDSYPLGPFDTVELALEEARVAHSGEPGV